MSVLFKSITVLGAGVIGLSTAIVLAESGYKGRVKIVAETRTPSTRASDIAAAFWYPFHVGAYVHDWAIQSYRHFRSLLKDPTAGVTDTPARELFIATPQISREAWLRELWWRHEITEVGFRELPASEVPAGFTGAATFSVPVIHMPTYMKYLETRFSGSSCSGEFENRAVDNIEDLFDGCDALVNCTGFGSATLVGVEDTQLVPCRGQIVRIKPMPEVRELLFITTGTEYRRKPLYIVPRGSFDIVLGGTTVDGRNDTVPRPPVTREILRRCATFCSALQSAERIESRVGVRPARRGGVRVELDGTRCFRKTLLHNYGHGGAGVTLSWGCALTVRSLIEQSQAFGVVRRSAS